MGKMTVIAVVLAAMAFAGGEAANIRRRGEVQMTSAGMTGGAEYKLVASGVCPNGCHAIQSPEACGTAVASLKDADMLPPDVPASTWLPARLAKFFLSPSYDPQSVCPDGGTIKKECSLYPHGCVFVPEGKPRVVFNAFATSTMPAYRLKQLVCECEQIPAESPQMVSMGACGAVHLKSTTMDVVTIVKTGETLETTDADGKLLEVPVATHLRLDCAYGYSFSGDRNGDRSLDMKCDAATQTTTISGSTTGEVLSDQGRECLANRCPMRALSKSDSHDDDFGLYMAYASVENLESLVVVHGETVRGVLCEPGHTLDSKPPSAVNSALMLECNDGLWALPFGQGDTGIKIGGAGDVMGVVCTPVQCPTDAPILSAGVGTLVTGPTHYTGSDSLEITCEDGFVLCTDADSTALTCPPEFQWHRTHESATTIVTRCNEDGEIPVEELMTLSCRPVECPKLEVTEESVNEDDGGFVDPPKMEQSLGWYVFTPDVAARQLVEVVCAKGYNMNGDRTSRFDSANLTCQETGEMQFADQHGGAIGSPPAGPLCKPIGCQVIRHPMAKAESEVATAPQVLHGNDLQLDCEPGFSYDRKGRRSEDPTWHGSTSNWQRTLTCDRGEYTCSGGWCDYGGASHDVRCFEVMCSVPDEHTMTFGNMDYGKMMEFQDHEQVSLSERMKLQFAQKETITLSCLPGFMLLGKTSGVCEYPTTCEDTWVGTSESLAGWTTPITTCERDPEYCMPLDDQWYKLRHAHREGSLEATRYLTSSVLVTCDDGFTLDNESPKDVSQEVKCVQGDEGPFTGKWLNKKDEPPQACERVTCDPPNPERYAAKYIDHADTCDHGLCAFSGNTVEYQCDSGYRWALFSNGNMPSGVDPDIAPEKTSMLCRSDGTMSFVEFAGHEIEGVTAPKCVPVQCLNTGADILDSLAKDTSSHEGKDTTDNLVSLLRLTYTWSVGAGVQGRLYKEESALQCIDGESFKMRCEADGKYKVRHTSTKTESSFGQAAQSLLTACGRQLRIQAPSTSPPMSKDMCMSLDADNTVSIQECRSGAAEQMWWFEGRNGACESKKGPDGATVLHSFDFCGELRSLKASADGHNVCILPPPADDGTAPVVGKCEEQSLWSLDSTTNTLMLQVPGEGQGFRRHRFVSAEVAPGVGNKQSFSLRLDDYFSASTEYGFDYVSPDGAVFE